MWRKRNEKQKNPRECITSKQIAVGFCWTLSDSANCFRSECIKIPAIKALPQSFGYDGSSREYASPRPT